MTIISRLVDAFRAPCPKRAAEQKLHEARLLLVEHECNLESYSASVSMLKARVLRLENASAPQAERKDSLLSVAKMAGQSKPSPRVGESRAEWDTRNGLHHVAAPANRSAITEPV